MPVRTSGSKPFDKRRVNGWDPRLAHKDRGSGITGRRHTLLRIPSQMTAPTTISAPAN